MYLRVYAHFCGPSMQAIVSDEPLPTFSFLGGRNLPGSSSGVGGKGSKSRDRERQGQSKSGGKSSGKQYVDSRNETVDCVLVQIRKSNNGHSVYN